MGVPFNLLIQKHFGAVYAGKAHLGKVSWNTKKNRGINGTMHFFLEITGLQFGKEISYIVLYFKVFYNLLFLDYP